MPLCLINTNIKREDLANDFEERVAKCIAETAQFPLEYCFVTVQTDLRSFCAGSKDPALICQLNSMYIFNDESNFENYYNNLFEVLKETTKLPGKRILVQLVACPDKMAKLGEWPVKNDKPKCLNKETYHIT